jgi:cell division protein FtsW
VATITPAKLRTTKARTPSVDSLVAPEVGALRKAATAWLTHPLASVYLVRVPALLLLALGSVMVWSASSVFAATQFSDANLFIKRQLVFAGIGLAGLLAIQRVPLDVVRRLGWVMFLIAGALMCVPFVMGKRIKGNLNWIDFGPMLRLQPSEIAKIVIILWGASLFTSKRKTLEDPRHLLFPFLPGALVLIGLTVMQHDLGTSIIMGLVVVAMLWNVGASLKLLGSFAAIVTAGVLVLVYAAPYRVQRILGFLNPEYDTTGINYQPNQAQFALASGGWWGVGLGRSRMKWGFLSEAHTDYILAITGEELGLIGTLSVVALFAILVYGGCRIALRSSSFYTRIVASGITAALGIQALVNIFMVLRLLPVLGVPLPLVSYGGSSLVMTLGAIGLLLRCAQEEPEAKKFLARRKKSKQPLGRLSSVFGVQRRA